MKWYSGIADFGGIESFKEVSKAGVCHPALAMRADANRHRFAMLYWVELDDFKAKVISFINSNNIILKSFVKFEYYKK